MLARLNFAVQTHQQWDSTSIPIYRRVFKVVSKPQIRFKGKAQNDRESAVRHTFWRMSIYRRPAIRHEYWRTIEPQSAVGGLKPLYPFFIDISIGRDYLNFFLAMALFVKFESADPVEKGGGFWQNYLKLHPGHGKIVRGRWY
jgi:hypothetical protein